MLNLLTFLSIAACNLAARAAASPSKRACSAQSPAPPSPGSANAATAGRLGRPVVLLFVNSPESFQGCPFLDQTLAVLV